MSYIWHHAVKSAFLVMLDQLGRLTCHIKIQTSVQDPACIYQNGRADTESSLRFCNNLHSSSVSFKVVQSHSGFAQLAVYLYLEGTE